MPLPVQRRSARGSPAFTLIELLVVIVIVAILLAIAIPAYLSQQTKAKDQKAKQYLAYAYRAIRGGIVDTSDQFPQSTSMVSLVQQSEPELTVESGNCYALGALTTNTVVIDSSSTSSNLLLCDKSDSGNIEKLTATPSGAPSFVDGTAVPLTVSGNEITDATRAADVQGDGLSNDSSTGVWESTTNLIPNGGFESSTNGWSITNATAATDSSQAKFGSSSMRVTATGSSPAADVFNVATGSPIPQGTTYTAQLWVRASTPSSIGETFRLQLNESGGASGTQTVGNLPYTTVVLTSGWQHLTYTGSVIQPDRTSIYLLTNLINGVSGDAVDIDGVQVERKPTATPYVETNGSTASRGAAEVQAPASLIGQSSTLWFAARVVIDSTDDTVTHYIAYLNVPGGYSIYLYRGQGGPNRVWGMQESSVSGIGWVDNANPAGTAHTVIGYVTPTQFGVSLDGGAFKTSARTSGTGLTPNALFIGGVATAQQLDGRLFWFACGTGTLSNADAATINEFGDGDPQVSSFPSTAQADFVWNGVASSGSLK